VVTVTRHTKTAAVDWEDPSRAVVVGVDGSERNKAAVAWATHQALGSGRPLTLLHVLGDYGVPIPHHSMATNDDRGRHVLTQMKADLLTEHPDLTVRHEMSSGATVNCLLDRTVDQAMLVVGKRGLSAIARTMIGSTSIAAAGRSRVPVVVVPDVWRQADHSDEPIVVGVDPDEVHERTLRFAFIHAQRCGVGVHLVFAIDPEPESARAHLMEADFYAHAKERAAERVEDALLPYRDAFPDVPVQHSEFRGHPGSALLDVAASAQMIVLGRNHSSRLGFPLGSLTRGILHHSTVPVAVVPSR
jgi:nucleotide-binding universal stress UspA family protein